MKHLFAVVILIGVVFLALAVPAAAQGVEPGKVIFGGEYTLESGQVLSGDLGVLGGQAVIEEEARVDGDVFVAGGTLDVRGRVDGNIAVFGGQVDLGDTAYVGGDVVSFGGSVNRANGAVVAGEVRSGESFEFPFWGAAPIGPNLVLPQSAPEPDFRASPGQWFTHWVWRMVRSMMAALALTVMALVVSLLWPRGVSRMGQTTLSQPVMAFLVGLLTWIVGIGLVVVLAITICLIPFAVLLSLVLLVAALLSWIVVGWCIGNKLLALLNLRNPSPVLEATSGTLIVTVLYFLAGIIPCMTFVLGVVVASFGLGAIVLTRFGTRPYPPLAETVLPAEPVVSPTTVPALEPPADVTAVSKRKE